MAAPDPAPSSDRLIDGLVLRPFRATRPSVPDDRLAALLCPPYDVIGPAERARLLADEPDNFVSIALPDPNESGYRAAAEALTDRIGRGVLAVDDDAGLYVYEMVSSDGHVTRGFVGAVQLRDPADGVVLPHENTMAGPVADRLALMTATEADLEPIYLMYDGGGVATQTLTDAESLPLLAGATTPDGTRHRLWTITAPDALADIAADLATRRAVIADGHHRYATYRERQRLRRPVDGAGPWDDGLTLLVDSSVYGPQVHPIHRVVYDLSLDAALDALDRRADVTPVDSADAAGLAERLPQLLRAATGFAAVITDGNRAALVQDPDGRLARAVDRSVEGAELADLDVTVLHRAVIENAWQMPDDVEHVGYAHSVAEAVEAAVRRHGVAVLVRATPAAAVAAVATAGGRMPRKSTLFTPKPASGLFLRLLGDAEVTA